MKAKNFLRRMFRAMVLVAASLTMIPSIWAKDFTIIVLPDTQFYSESHPGIFTSQTQWIVDHKDTLNIAYVVHVGDIVDNYDQTTQWDNARAAMRLLEDPTTTGLPDGIPYGLVPGNHDEPTGNYNNYFGVSRFQGRSYYGGGYPPGSNDNNYTLFSAGGMDFIVINLEYLTPATGVLEWADSLLKAYANRRAIVVSHYLLNLDATWGPWGQQIYEALKDNPNLFLMLAGHIHGESRRVDVYNGNTVNTLLADYQSLANGGNGWLRLLKFSPASDEISVMTYSPYLNQYDTDSNSQFSLFYDMGGTTAISFQDGIWPNSDYSGTRDTVLSQNAPSANFGSDLVLYVDGDDPSGSGKDLSTLLYWDVSAIPIGSAVKGASIALNVVNQSSHSYQVYEIKRDWVESQSTWNSYAGGQGWETPGALGVQDRGSTVLGSLSPSSTGPYVINLNSDGVALIQSWVVNPAGNHGFIIANSGSSDGVDFDSREVSTVSNRPTLTVRYSSDQPENQPPVAAFTSNCSGLNCNFDATDTEDPDGTIVNYTWDFGDGKTGTGRTISHRYAAAGTYNVVLTVTDNGGATDSYESDMGFMTQIPSHGDYDGDGKTDIAIWRPGDGNWYIRNSANGTVSTQQWGAGYLNDWPVPGDYDGDGKMDYGVWRPGEGNWYIRRSSDGSVAVTQWGTGTFFAEKDVPVPGDFDGDGKTDIAVWRPGDGNWYILRSSDGSVAVTQWGSGALNDVPVPGDYDGDGKADIAVWRPGDGNWYILRSSDGAVAMTQWGSGAANDVPVPGDYDGDGKTDIAVWRPGDGNWYIRRSSDGAIAVTQWGSGAVNDVPVPGDYDGDRGLPPAAPSAAGCVWRSPAPRGSASSRTPRRPAPTPRAGCPPRGRPRRVTRLRWRRSHSLRRVNWSSGRPARSPRIVEIRSSTIPSSNFSPTLAAGPSMAARSSLMSSASTSTRLSRKSG